MTPAEFAETFMKAPAHLPYTGRSPAADVWDAVCAADAPAAQEGGGGDKGGLDKVQLLYSGYVIDPGPRDCEYRVGGWTREHVWPQSHGGMTTSRPGIGTDVHNIFAADQSVNSARSEKDFADLPEGEHVVDASDTHGYSGALLAKTSDSFWEPPDKAKGGVARAMLYMACRYAGDGLRLVAGPTEKGGTAMGDLATLLAWNERFPPDSRERRRNDLVERFQGNRNPFIDDHGLAGLVDWG